MPRRCLLVGAQTSPHPALAVAQLKAAADAEPALAGRWAVETVQLVLPSADEVVAAVLARRPDAVGFSCYLWNTAAFLDALPVLRAGLPDALIVLGGPDAYPQARSLLEDHPEIDVVVMGEGERTLPRLLLAGREPSAWGAVPGVAFRQDERFVETPDAPPIEDLDALPSPYLTGAASVGPGHIRVTLESSRGCPYNCSYCDWPGRGQKPRNFSVERIMAELEHVVAQGKDLLYVHFTDADIFIDKPRAKELIKRSRRILAGTNVILAFEAYVGRLDDELLELLDYPNFLIEGGVQTAAPEALKTMNRFFHREKIEEAVGRVHRKAPAVRFWFQLICGLPGDTFETFQDTVDWALSVKPDGVACYPALVLPGAEMGRHPERFGIEFSSRPPRRVLSAPGFPRADVEAANAFVVALTILIRVPALHRTLSHLAELPGGAAVRPFVSLYERFARLAEERGLLPERSQSRRAADCFADGANEADRILRDLPRLLRLIELVEGFAAGELRARGREELLADFERFWRLEEQLALWNRRAADVDEALAERVAADGRGARAARWLGAELVNPELALARRALPGAEVTHVLGACPPQHRCLAKVRHVDRERELAQAAGAGGDLFVLSHLFSRLDAPARDGLLGALERGAAPGAKLVLWDGLLGRSPLETVRPASGAPRSCAPREVADVLAELGARGWRSAAAPERAAGAWHLVFTRR